MSAGWTIKDAVAGLDPAMDEDEVRAMVLLYRIPAAGQRHGRGRPAETYDQPAILRAHAAVVAHRRGLLHAVLSPCRRESALREEGGPSAG